MSSDSSSSGVSKVTLGVVAVIITVGVVAVILQISRATNEEIEKTKHDIEDLRKAQGALAQSLNSGFNDLTNNIREQLARTPTTADPTAGVKDALRDAMKPYNDGFKTTLELYNKSIEAKFAAAEAARRDGDKVRENKELDRAREAQAKLQEMQKQIEKVAGMVKTNKPGELPKVPLPIPDMPETSPADADKATKAILGMALFALAAWNPALAMPAMLLGAILGIGGSTETREAVVDVARAVSTNGSVKPSTLEFIRQGLKVDGKNPNIVFPLQSLVEALPDNAENRVIKEELRKAVEALGPDWGLSDDATAVRKALETGDTESAMAATPEKQVGQALLPLRVRQARGGDRMR